MKIFVLGEDSHYNSFYTLKNLIIRSLYSIDTSFNPNSDDFDIIESTNFKQVVQGNNWRNKTPTTQFNQLCDFLADIYQSEDDYIFWHIDADKIWENETSIESSQNISQFYERVIERLNIICSKIPFDQDVFFKKIILMVPFYSIEAWLYENYNILETSHKHEYDTLKNLEQKYESKFDIIHKIKDETHVADKMNLNLSSNFPCTKASSKEMSYALFLKNIEANTILKSRLPRYC